MFQISKLLTALIAVAWFMLPAAASAQDQGSCSGLMDSKVAVSISHQVSNPDGSWTNVTEAGSATLQMSRQGCVAVTFSAQVSAFFDPPFIQALLDGTSCSPFQGQFATNTMPLSQVFQSMTFYCYSRTVGTHTVQVQFHDSVTGQRNIVQLDSHTLEVRYRKQ